MLDGREAYRGFSMRFYAFPADARVPKSKHTWGCEGYPSANEPTFEMSSTSARHDTGLLSRPRTA